MRALAGAGALAHYQRHTAEATPLVEASLAIAREIGDDSAIAWALHVLGRIHYFEGDATIATQLGEASLAAADAAGDRWLAGWAFHLLGLAAHIAGDYPTARAHYAESLRVRAEVGDVCNSATVRSLLGAVAHYEGNFAVAATLYRESFATSRALGFRLMYGNMFGEVAALAADMGQLQAAVRMAGAASRLTDVVGTPPIPLIEALLERGLQRARAELAPEVYAAEWASGLAMAEQEAIEEATSIAETLDSPSGYAPPGSSDHESAPPMSIGPPDALSPRELEVLRLIGSGLTNKEIAAELVISVPTVERHVTHVYAKIGARGRAEAATYAARRRGLL
jgi:non-specific serine/threonine protein kinase